MKNIIFSLFLMFILTSCGGFQPQDSLLKLSNCTVPCWNGIVPGQTNKKELLEILSALPIVKKSSILDRGSSKSFDSLIQFSTSMVGKPDDVRFENEALILNDKVVLLWFWGDLGTTVDEMLKYTNKNVKTYTVYSDPIKFVYLLAPENGICFGFNAAGLPWQVKTEIKPETPLEMIAFFDPQYYELMMDQKMFSLGVLENGKTKELMYDWNGYGNLEEKYPFITPMP